MDAVFFIRHSRIVAKTAKSADAIPEAMIIYCGTAGSPSFVVAEEYTEKIYVPIPNTAKVRFVISIW